MAIRKAVSATERATGRKFRINWGTVLIYCLLVPLGLALVVPVWYMVDMAFTPENFQLRWPIVWVPRPFTFANFQHILMDKTLPVFRWLMNSLIVTGVGTVLTLSIASLSAYAFARLEFPGRDLIFSVLIASLMVPATVTLIPSFLLLRDLGTIPGIGQHIGLGSYGALWLPALAHAWAIFFLRQQFFAIPRDLEDAAYIDGASRFRVYWNVCLPLVTSALVAQGIFAALGFWNNLFWPLIVLSDRNDLTLPVGLLVLSQGSYVQRGLAFAGGVLASAPPLIVYAIFQRQIIQGIATTGLTGR
jgi:multiple sugar transport system permease protein